MRILGIETSCDETAAAVIEVESGKFIKSKIEAPIQVLSNVIASQIKIHAKTGGVVPEVAAREHEKVVLPVIEEALNMATKVAKESKATQAKTFATSIDAIAVTAGPGLVTSLLVGVETARTLAYLWRKPLIAVNHLEGHICANFLPREKIRKIRNPKSEIRNFCPFGTSPVGKQFPILCLIVSGGHTELVLMRNYLDYKIIGATRDDAAGECFDKVAKILGLGYPGGPAIAAIAAKCKMKNVKCKIIEFPRPMMNSGDFDFSFSGLKTAVLYKIKNFPPKADAPRAQKLQIKNYLPEICYEVQEAIVDVLVAKTIAAAKKYKVNTVMLGGGVSANQHLRQRFTEAMEKELPNTRYSLPVTQYTTDNAAMIAAAGYFHAFPPKADAPRVQKKDFTPWSKLGVDPNWQIGRKRGNWVKN